MRIFELISDVISLIADLAMMIVVASLLAIGVLSFLSGTEVNSVQSLLALILISICMGVFVLQAGLNEIGRKLDDLIRKRN